MHIGYEYDAKCDTCGAQGAYDFMGDYMCQKCLDTYWEETQGFITGEDEDYIDEDWSEMDDAWFDLYERDNFGDK